MESRQSLDKRNDRVGNPGTDGRAAAYLESYPLLLAHGERGLLARQLTKSARGASGKPSRSQSLGCRHSILH